MKSQVPAWLGWPGGLRPPGCDWIPGSKLRAVILVLAYAFLALALTVNYAASVIFFLLAILGMYVGFRRGFVAGLTRVEKLVMIAFVAYPAVAILSYMLGTQTNVGFRFLGRDLRFLLFIPVYLAIRWSCPKIRDVGIAFSLGAFLSCAIAVWQFTHGIQPVGVAGVHITFGDLSLLSGAVGFALLIRGSNKLLWLGLAGALAGLVASLLSGARGGWIAIPVLGFVLAWGYKKNLLVAGVVIIVVVATVVLSSTILRQRITDAVNGMQAFALYEKSHKIPMACISSLKNLKLVKNFAHRYGIYYRQGINGHVGIMPIQQALPGHWGKSCQGNYAIVMGLPNSAKGDAKLGFRVVGDSPASTEVSVLIHGNAHVTLGYHSKKIAVDSKKWRMIRLKANLTGAHTASELIVSVLPGEKAWLVPVQPSGNPYISGLMATSLPARFEMWGFASSLFVRSPVIGAGTGSFSSFLDAGIQRSHINYLLKGYDHPHSDYLNALYSKGLFGFFVFLSLLILPAVASPLLPSRGDNVSSKRLIKPALLVATGMAVFGLSETMFIHSLVITIYSIWTAILIASATCAKTSA